MQSAVSIPQQTYNLNITLDGNVSLKEIKRTLNMIKGVASVKVCNNSKKKTGIELAMEDIDKGRVSGPFHSVDELWQHLDL